MFWPHVRFLSPVFVCAGYLGRLRRKATTPRHDAWDFAWKRKCVFQYRGHWHTWLVAFNQPVFSVGCWVCHFQKQSCAFSKLQVPTKKAIQISNFVQHQKSKSHQEALKKLEEDTTAQPRSSEGDTVGIVSGRSLGGPRVDKWVSALDLLLCRAGFQRQGGHAASQAVGSAMKPGGDGSSTVVKKMLECLRYNLDALDLRYMKESVASSIAVDKGDEHLVVYARCLHPFGIYDFLVGIDDNAVPDTWSEADASRAVLKALKAIVERACTKRLPSKRTESIYFSSEDALCQDTFKSFCHSVVSLQADGGPTEQRALFEASPPAKELAGTRDVLFPNVVMISRDRAHRCRSIDKGFWSSLPNTYQEFLAKLVTGDRSFARMVQTSQKFRNLFERMQTEEPCEGFSKVLKNCSFADHRFDSRKKPLFRLFKLLPVAIRCLEEICAQRAPFDAAEKTWAAELLRDFEGDEGYNRLVGSAVAADCLLLAWPMLKVSDQDAADYALAAPAAAEAQLRLLLLDGGLWLPAAKDTLTHTVLRAIRERRVFIGKGGDKSKAVDIRWPAPSSASRRQPVEVAKQLLA